MEVSPSVGDAAMTYGTSYFRSHAHAVYYYRAQYGTLAEDIVRGKIKVGDIHLGQPPLKDGETCFLIDNGTRWAIKERSK